MNVRDVRHIVLTHLDFDHAGGLDDFPEATVHMLQIERDVAVAQRSYHAEMDVERPHCTPGLLCYQWLMQQDGGMRGANQQRLRKLKAEHGRSVQIMSSHDVSEFERAAHRPLGEPLTRASLTGSLA